MKEFNDFDVYQDAARSTAFYGSYHKIIYPALGLAGESGEICEKIKKALRDHNSEFSPERKEAIALEIGDLTWYLANLAADLDIPFSSIAKMNLEKLQSRKDRNKLGGDGDNR